MRHLIMTSLLVLCGAIVAVAQPRLEVQDSVDWGVVVPDAPLGETAKVYADVKLKNVGTETLRISEVRPGCGCTSAPIEKDTLAPGEETKISVTLNLPLANGPIHKVITVQSNDPKGPARILNLVADVQRPLQLSSSFIPFNQGKVGEWISGFVTFTVQGDHPITINARVDQSNAKVVTPMPYVVQPGSNAVVEVAVRPSNQGTFQVKVHFKTDQNGYESFDLSGYGVADPAE